MNIINGISIVLVIIFIVIIIFKPKNEVKSENKIEVFIEKNSKVIFFIILVFAILLRIVLLQDIPVGVNVDEAGIAYDASSMANYGVDRDLNKNPVYLINYGDGQNVLYTYVTSLFIKIFGYSVFILRLPAVLFSIGGIVAAYFLVKEHRGKTMGLLFMFIITMVPWEIMKARWGLESNLLSPMFIISIFLLSKAVKKQKGRYFLLSGISFGITLYAYAVSYVILPIFLLMAFIYLKFKKEINFKQIIFFGTGIIFFAIPLILLLLINNNIIHEIKTNFITIPKLPAYRQGEVSLGNIKYNLFSIWSIFYRDNLPYNSLPDFGTVYMFSFAILFGGIFIFIKKINDGKNLKEIFSNINKVDVFMLFALISSIICGLLIYAPNINKINAVYIPLIYFISLTIYYILRNRKKIFLIIIIMYIIFFTMFCMKYFSQKNPNILFDNSTTQVTEYVDNKFSDTSRKIYFDKMAVFRQPYIYTLLANKISPYEFASATPNTWSPVISYGRYNFYENSDNINELVQDENAIYIILKSDYMKLNIQNENNNIDEFMDYYIIYK
ncbi:MAG: glycosyltransferase family 39 protein [Oscillospiraceae bacterium]|nr:glycosyltransferase family 39 protein [Oscillospiraceae bacterium]